VEIKRVPFGAARIDFVRQLELGHSAHTQTHSALAAGNPHSAAMGKPEKEEAVQQIMVGDLHKPAIRYILYLYFSNSLYALANEDFVALQTKVEAQPISNRFKGG